MKRKEKHEITLRDFVEWGRKGGRKGGKARSKAKAMASRTNGSLGGRKPKKTSANNI